MKRAKGEPNAENQEVVVEHREGSPLSNPVISKTWYECSLPAWRQTVWVNLGVQRNQTNESGNRLSVESYMELMKTPGDPYKMLGKNCYRKFNINTFGQAVMLDDLQLDFWSTIGLRMTHLEISKAEITSRDDLRRVLFEFTPKMEFLSLNCNVYTCGPRLENWTKLYDKFHNSWEERFRPSPSQIQKNLTRLEVCENYDGIRTSTSDLPLCLMEVLAHFPNLKVVKLTKQRLDLTPVGGFAMQFFQFLHCLSVVKANCGDHYLSQIKNLRVNRISKEISSVFGLHELNRMVHDNVALMFEEPQAGDN